jgi:hypothetical protein
MATFSKATNVDENGAQEAAVIPAEKKKFGWKKGLIIAGVVAAAAVIGWKVSGMINANCDAEDAEIPAAE